MQPTDRSHCPSRVAEQEPTGAALVLGACAILVLTVAAYCPALTGGFVWDDHSHVENNPLLFGPGGLKRIWFSLDAPQYYPLVFTSFWLERALWGVNSAGYHCVNLLLHIANALLVWRLLRRLCVPGAWLAAAFFALHPVNVESVAWITERKNTLSMLFFLLSLLGFLYSEGEASEAGNRKAESPGGKSRTVSHEWYALSLLAFLLALLSKTAVAPLGLVLLGLAWWRRGRIGRGDLLRSAPFFVLALLLVPITLLVEHHAGSEVVRADGFCARLAGAGWAFWFYLYKTAWPLHLVFIYPRWQIDPVNPLAYAPGILAVGMLLVCWCFRQGWGRAGLVSVGFFAMMLLPVLGLVNIYFMRYSLVSDHWQYFAIVGPLALMAAGITRLLDRLRRAAPVIRPVACGSLLLGLGVLTFGQSWAYKDDEALWRHTLAKNPAAWMAHINLGVLLARKGHVDGAISQYNQAIRLAPGNAEAHNNLGNALDKLGQTAEAIEHYHQAIRFKPDYAEAHYNLGTILGRKGQITEAIRQLHEAVRLKPDHAEAHYNLGIALSSGGQTTQAIHQFQEALRLKPDNVEARRRLEAPLAANADRARRPHSPASP